MIEDNRLRAFLEVARHGNFTRAAEALSFSQPAVTLQIKSLEQELGISLFDRSGQKIVLSTAGQMLLPHAEAMHKIAEQAKEAVHSLGDEHSGHLRIGASTSITQYVVPQLVAQFAQKHKKIEFKLMSGNTERIAELLESEEVDIGMVEGPLSKRNLKVEIFREDEIVLIVPNEGLWKSASSDPWTLDQLKLAPLILREPGSGTRTIIEQLLKTMGVKLSDLNVSMEMDSTEAIKSVVIGGLGVALVSRTAIAKELQLNLLSTVPLSFGSITRNLNFVIPRDKPLSSIAQAFKKFASTQVALKSQTIAY